MLEYIYPKKKVIMGYALCGGTIILFLANFMSYFIAIYENGYYPYSIDIDIDVYVNVDTMIMGFFWVGLIPSLSMGIYFAKNNTIIQSLKDYFKIAFIGSFIIFLYSFFLTLIIGSTIDLSGFVDVYFAVIMPYTLFIGVVSATICGKLFLPKLPKGFEK